MQNRQDREARRLIREIGRYLAVVDVFRAAGCEPTWRPELATAVTTPKEAPR